MNDLIAMATNVEIFWAKIGISGGNLFGYLTPSSVSFELWIFDGKTKGLINHIAGIPDVPIPPDFSVPVNTTVTGSAPYQISFEGSKVFDETTITISGSAQIGSTSDNPGTCSYKVQSGEYVVNVENAKVIWVQAPQ